MSSVLTDKGGIPSVTALGEQSSASRVLLVEDNGREATLMREMLRSTWTGGLVITHVESLGDATQELLDHGSSCVLLDLTLPDGDGLLVLEHVRTAAPDAPVVVLAEQQDEGIALQAVQRGAQDYLVKSEINPALLRRSVKLAIERKRSEVQLAHQALHDPLTGLPNRALFLDRLGVALDRVRRTSASVAVLFLDVDNFKEINDSLGHAAGDELLIGLAHRLRAMLRPMDTVARFAGDEFTFLFEDLESEREVVLIAERISRAASVPLMLEGREASITVSIGIAMVGDPTATPETMIREADVAMYRAKELGRSRWELFDEASRQRATDRLELETALRHAVERSELRVLYQPKVTLDDRSAVIGFEALVRWEHPERGLISPSEFIPLAEETGLVLAIGEFVLAEALVQIGRWRIARPELTMSVNLSFRQLEDTGLVSMLNGAIRTSRADPAALCLEVTEGAINHNPEASARMLQALKTVGVQLAIDDFGTGYSSLTELKSLPIDTIKIHESFVSDLGGDLNEGPLVRAVVALGHALGITVVAEGVETDTQLASLRELGFDGAQGFLFGAPVSEHEAEALLDGR
jgi:diguanylate cyclase (GGDEF)-like protein